MFKCKYIFLVGYGLVFLDNFYVGILVSIYLYSHTTKGILISERLPKYIYFLLAYHYNSCVCTIVNIVWPRYDLSPSCKLHIHLCIMHIIKTSHDNGFRRQQLTNLPQGLCWVYSSHRLVVAAGGSSIA